MSAVWLTSDLHLGHQMVAETRGFENAYAHDMAILRNWRKMIQPGDTVWVLGDISSGGAAAQEYALAQLVHLPGRKFLVAGNHDSVHPMHGVNANLRWNPLYASAFGWVGSQARINVEGERLTLSHFPFEADRDEVPRHPSWRPRDVGQYLAHGHTHFDKGFVGRELHVGLDAHRLRPVPLGEIAKYIKENKDVATWPGGGLIA